MDAFKAGDTVKLKSGGPLMTVEGIGTMHNTRLVRCTWFIDDVLKRGEFQPESLVADDGTINIA